MKITEPVQRKGIFTEALFTRRVKSFAILICCLSVGQLADDADDRHQCCVGKNRYVGSGDDDGKK